MSSIDIAKQTLLQPAQIQEQDLDKLLYTLSGQTIDAADIYLQSSRYESWSLEDGIIKNGRYNIEQGAGLRVISGEKTGFAYSDEIVMPALLQAAQSARAISQAGQSGQIKIASQLPKHQLYQSSNPIERLSSQQKIDLLYAIDSYTRQLDSKVKQVMVGLNSVFEVILVVSSDGRLSADVRPLVRLNIQVIAEDNGKREQGFAGGGGRYDYHSLFEQDRHFDFAKEAVRQALVNLDAKETPAGQMPVVLASGWPGVLLHEAIGHGLEGDFNRKGCSAFSGRIGEKVASPLCTVVDDGTLAGRRGSLNIDDEGTATQSTVLIEKGYLKQYMQDNLNAKLMGTRSTGNGRRESYAHLPMPRMTNTYMLAGDTEPDDIIASVDKGLYAVNFGGGQVDITSGKFVFSASEAYWIENGKIAYPVKGATLIGHGPDVLTKVSMVGNDLALDTGVGVCGKEGQSVPVGVGQPTLKVDRLTVGGTSA